MTDEHAHTDLQRYEEAIRQGLSLRTALRELGFESLFNPPRGWHVFGTHVDAGDIKLEFWGDDGSGMPLWERPAPHGPETGLEGRANAPISDLDEAPTRVDEYEPCNDVERAAAIELLQSGLEDRPWNAMERAHAVLASAGLVQ